MHKIFIKIRKRYVFAVLIFLSVGVTTWCAIYEKIIWYSSPIDCYWTQQPISHLPDIDETLPAPLSIFFTETSCWSYLADRLIINARQACAIESAALHNPKAEVYFLFAVAAQPDFFNDTILRELVSYPNVHLRSVNIERLARGSSLEWLVSSDGELRKSDYAVSHASDILRYLLLWKYGGIYLDTDFVLLRSLEDVSFNYAGQESAHAVAAGVMSFDGDGEGHRLAEECVNDLNNSFSGQDWGNNGPGVITRLARKHCGDLFECNGIFRVYPSETFYPIPWRRWKEYFEPGNIRKFNELIKDSWAIHVWNAKSKDFRPRGGSPYMIIAKTHCPKVYAVASKYF